MSREKRGFHHSLLCPYLRPKPPGITCDNVDERYTHRSLVTQICLALNYHRSYALAPCLSCVIATKRWLLCCTRYEHQTERSWLEHKYKKWICLVLARTPGGNGSNHQERSLPLLNNQIKLHWHRDKYFSSCSSDAHPTPSAGRTTSVVGKS